MRLQVGFGASRSVCVFFCVCASAGGQERAVRSAAASVSKCLLFSIPSNSSHSASPFRGFVAGNGGCFSRSKILKHTGRF